MTNSAPFREMIIFHVRLSATWLPTDRISARRTHKHNVKKTQRSQNDKERKVRLMWISASTAASKLERSIHDQIFSATWNEPEVEEVTSSVGAACTVHCDTIKWSASIYDERVWDDVKIKEAPATPRTQTRTLWEKLKNVRARCSGRRREILYCLVWLFLCAAGPAARSREVALFCLKWHLGAQHCLQAAWLWTLAVQIWWVKWV